MSDTLNHLPEPVLSNDAQAIITFMGVLAHEIRSEISAICTVSDMMRESFRLRLSGQKENLSIIESSGYSALRILDNMMKTVLFSNGKLEIKPVNERIKFKDWLRLLVRKYDFMISLRDIKIKTDIGSNVPKYINTDPVKLGQILSNLISNAVKSSPHHSTVRINVKFYNSQQLTFLVTDQAGGFPEEKIPLLFRPFQQLEQGRAGAGLGLYVSKLCVTALGGKIMAYNQDGGATFMFFIKLNADKD